MSCCGGDRHTGRLNQVPRRDDFSGSWTVELRGGELDELEREVLNLARNSSDCGKASLCLGRDDIMGYHGING